MHYKLLEAPLIKIYAASVLSVLSFFFGQLYNDALLAILMLFIIDFATGLIASVIYEGQPIRSSDAARPNQKGLLDSVKKFAIYLAAISAAYFADLTIPGSVFQSVMIAFVGTTEFISILENIARMGYNTPKKMLGQLTSKRDSL